VSDITKSHTIGDTVYRIHYKPYEKGKPLDLNHVDWYEPFEVTKVTAKRIYVRHPVLPWKNFYLDKEELLRRGKVGKWPTTDLEREHFAGMYVAERPQEYVKQTLGYLIAQKPRNILGISADAGEEEAKRAYYKLAKKHHPDSGVEPDPRKFQEAAEAFKAVKKGVTLTDLIEGVRDAVNKELKKRNEKDD
jgi:hypothetical protein